MNRRPPVVFLFLISLISLISLAPPGGPAAQEVDCGDANDCNRNGLPDGCDIEAGRSQDCDHNGIPDSCDLEAGESRDCDDNGVPDSCDIEAGRSQDCNRNRIPDSCEIGFIRSEDCDDNGVPDSCDIEAGRSQDCNRNGVPDSCEIELGGDPDCNFNRNPDSCDIEAGRSQDCNRNGIPDSCDLATGRSVDLDRDGVPDECVLDCNGNGLLDEDEVDRGLAPDCNDNDVPDECDLLASLQFTRGVAPPGLESETTRGFRFGDLDDDGDLDIGLLEPFEVVLRENRGGFEFSELASVELGSDPAVLRFGDLDGDGDLDLVTANDTADRDLPGNVTVVFNDGDGSFSRGGNFGIGNGPTAVVLEDFDLDGDLDIAVASAASGIVSFLFNFGDGTFEGVPPWEYPFYDAKWLESADVDGDGRPELVVGLERYVAILEYRGDGTFETSQVLDRGWSTARFLATADLDGDGDLDIVAGGTTFRNDGGVFEESVGLRGTILPAAADLDGDGDVDLLSHHPAGAAVLSNDGNGSFFDTKSRVDLGREPAAVDIRDFDGDGRLDIAFVGDFFSGDRFRVAYNRLEPYSRDCNLNGVPDRCDLFDDFSADFDLDGVPDECQLGSDDCNRNGVFDPFEVLAAPGLVDGPVFDFVAPTVDFDAGDLDGDGVGDLVGIDIHHLWVARGVGDGTFGPVTALSEPVGVSVDVVDIDGDGRLDLLVGSSLLLNRGDLQFDVAARLSGSPLRPAHLDDDGDVDLVALHREKLKLFRNVGDETFVEIPGPNPGACPRRLRVGDVDGDGLDDLVLGRDFISEEGCDPEQTLLVFFNQGDLTFEARGLGDERADRDVEVTDLNGDGRADIVAEYHVFFGDPDRRLERSVRHALYPQLRTLDFDGDGDEDLLGQNFVGRKLALAVRLNHFETGLTGLRVVALEEERRIRASADVDGDGLLDLLVVHNSGLSVVPLLNRTERARGIDRDRDGVPDECQDTPAIFLRGDCNGDERVNLTDAICALRHLFRGEPAECETAADADDSGVVEAADAILVIRYLFLGGAAPAAPFPECGADPTDDAIDCEVRPRCDP